MYFTKKSDILMSLIKKKEVNKTQQTKNTISVIEFFYHKFILLEKYFKKLKKEDWIKTEMKKKNKITQISKPKYFNEFSFPKEVLKHIDDHFFIEIHYSFSLLDRFINIYFILDVQPLRLTKYNKYVEWIMIWLCIINEKASSFCSKELSIYLYFTSLEKKLPSYTDDGKINYLDELHVNTAFTRTCEKRSEIVIYRKEEWFKVFLHETFHNFGLDFSNMHCGIVHKKILSIFQVNSDVNLYEAYSEVWAEIINVIFCSFFHMKNKENINELFMNFNYYINLEINYSFFQAVKTLDYMGIKYTDLIDNNIDIKNQYKENTNVLSYYIIKLVLIYHYQDFLLWCKMNNGEASLFSFKKTSTNLNEFCKFIEKKYKTKLLLNEIKWYEVWLHKLKATNTNKRDNYINYFLNNMRMTVCELD